VIRVPVRDDDLFEPCVADIESCRDRLEMTRMADAGVDHQRRPAAGNQIRIVAAPGHRARVERIEENGIEHGRQKL